MTQSVASKCGEYNLIWPTNNVSTITKSLIFLPAQIFSVPEQQHVEQYSLHSNSLQDRQPYLHLQGSTDSPGNIEAIMSLMQVLLICIVRCIQQWYYICRRQLIGQLDMRACISADKTSINALVSAILSEHFHNSLCKTFLLKCSVQKLVCDKSHFRYNHKFVKYKDIRGVSYILTRLSKQLHAH